MLTYSLLASCKTESDFPGLSDLLITTVFQIPPKVLLMVELKDRMLELQRLIFSPEGKKIRLTDLLIRCKVRHQSVLLYFDY